MMEDPWLEMEKSERDLLAGWHWNQQRRTGMCYVEVMNGTALVSWLFFFLFDILLTSTYGTLDKMTWFMHQIQVSIDYT